MSYDDIRKLLSQTIRGENLNHSTETEEDDDFDNISDSEFWENISTEIEDDEEDEENKNLLLFKNAKKFEILDQELLNFNRQFLSTSSKNLINNQNRDDEHKNDKINDNECCNISSLIQIISKYCPRILRICPICDKSMIYVRRHVLTVHFQLKRFYCSECSMKTYFNYDMKRHYHSHQRNTNQKRKSWKKPNVNINKLLRILKNSSKLSSAMN